MIVEITFSTRVTRNSTSPRPNADSVRGLLNSWSPVRLATMCTVTVVMVSSGFSVRLGSRPAAMTTIMVSPSARETPSSAAETMPGSAAGSSTCLMVSDLVVPRA